MRTCCLVIDPKYSIDSNDDIKKAFGYNSE